MQSVHKTGILLAGVVALSGMIGCQSCSRASLNRETTQTSLAYLASSDTEASVTEPSTPQSLSQSGLNLTEQTALVPEITVSPEEGEAFSEQVVEGASPLKPLGTPEESFAQQPDQSSLSPVIDVNNGVSQSVDPGQTEDQANGIQMDKDHQQAIPGKKDAEQAVSLSDPTADNAFQNGNQNINNLTPQPVGNPSDQPGMEAEASPSVSPSLPGVLALGGEATPEESLFSWIQTVGGTVLLCYYSDSDLPSQNSRSLQEVAEAVAQDLQGRLRVVEINLSVPGAPQLVPLPLTPALVLYQDGQFAQMNVSGEFTKDFILSFISPYLR